jgi:hypothetical protein
VHSWPGLAIFLFCVLPDDLQVPALRDAIGSFIEFNNRFVNALVDTVLFAVVFGALVHFGYLHLAFSSLAPAATTGTP